MSGFCHRFKVERRVEHRFADIELHMLDIARHLVELGQRHKIAHQRVHAHGLAFDGADPFVFALAHLQYVRVGRDDGQRRFQFVAGVGDKLLLLLDAAAHRRERGACEQIDREREQDDKDHAHKKRDRGQREGLLQLAFKIEKDHDRIAGGRVLHIVIAVDVQKAVARLLAVDLGGVFKRGLVADRGDVLGGNIGHHVAVELDHKIACGIGRFHRDRCAAEGIPKRAEAVVTRRVGQHAVVLRDQIKQAFGVAVALIDVDDVYRKQLHKHNGKQREDRDGDKFALQSFQHLISSSV